MAWLVIGGGLIVLLAIFFLLGGRGRNEGEILVDVDATLAGLTVEQRAAVTSLIRVGRKLEAIKYLRSEKCLDLVIAKRIVDGWSPLL